MALLFIGNVSPIGFYLAEGYPCGVYLLTPGMGYQSAYRLFCGNQELFSSGWPIRAVVFPHMIAFRDPDRGGLIVLDAAGRSTLHLSFSDFLVAFRPADKRAQQYSAEMFQYVDRPVHKEWVAFTKKAQDIAAQVAVSATKERAVICVDNKIFPLGEMDPLPDLGPVDRLWFVPNNRGEEDIVWSVNGDVFCYDKNLSAGIHIYAYDTVLESLNSIARAGQYWFFAHNNFVNIVRSKESIGSLMLPRSVLYSDQENVYIFSSAALVHIPLKQLTEGHFVSEALRS